MCVLEEWGYLSPSEWLKLNLKEKALFQAMLESIGKSHKDAMEKK